MACSAGRLRRDALLQPEPHLVRWRRFFSTRPGSLPVQLCEGQHSQVLPFSAYYMLE